MLRACGAMGEDSSRELLSYAAPAPPNSPVQRSISGDVIEYTPTDHSYGEQFPGKQPITTQLSLFDTGFRRRSGQLSLFDSGFSKERPRVRISEKTG